MRRRAAYARTPHGQSVARYGLWKAQQSAIVRDAIGPIVARTPGLDSVAQNPEFRKSLEQLGLR